MRSAIVFSSTTAAPMSRSVVSPKYCTTNKGVSRQFSLADEPADRFQDSQLVDRVRRRPLRRDFDHARRRHDAPRTSGLFRDSPGKPARLFPIPPFRPLAPPAENA